MASFSFMVSLLPSSVNCKKIYTSLKKSCLPTTFAMQMLQTARRNLKSPSVKHKCLRKDFSSPLLRGQWEPSGSWSSVRCPLTFLRHTFELHRLKLKTSSSAGGKGFSFLLPQPQRFFFKATAKHRLEFQYTCTSVEINMTQGACFSKYGLRSLGRPSPVWCGTEPPDASIASRLHTAQQPQQQARSLLVFLPHFKSFYQPQLMVLLLSLPPDSISAAGLAWGGHSTRPRRCPGAALQSTEAGITTEKPLFLQLASSGQPTSTAPSIRAVWDDGGEWSPRLCSGFDKPCYLALFKTWQRQYINPIFLTCSIILERFFVSVQLNCVVINNNPNDQSLQNKLLLNKQN